MSDIVERLRRGEAEGVDGWWFVMAEAADEIEKLRAALNRLHDAASDISEDEGMNWREKDWWRYELRAAAAALKETGG